MNVGSIADTLRFVERAAPRRRVLFYFNTPYYGVDDLFLPPDARAVAAETIVRLKRQGYPILNSAPGIRAAATGRFPHPLRYTVVVDATGEYRCCRAVANPDVCRHCGYSACAEMELIRQWHPLAIREALRCA